LLALKRYSDFSRKRNILESFELPGLRTMALNMKSTYLVQKNKTQQNSLWWEACEFTSTKTLSPSAKKVLVRFPTGDWNSPLTERAKLSRELDITTILYARACRDLTSQLYKLLEHEA